MLRAAVYRTALACVAINSIADFAAAALKGDVNGDGIVNNADIAPFASLLLGIQSGTIAQQCAADTNEDHNLNAADVPPMVDLLRGLVPAQYAQLGHWDCAFDWGLPGAPSTAIHGALVPTQGPGGEIRASVLTFGYFDNPASFVWNPDTGAFVRLFPPPATVISNCPVPQPPRNAELFCSSHCLLADGKLLVTGGNGAGADLECVFEDRAPAGTPFAFTFDGLSGLDGTWTQTASMARGRWYPTSVTLADGRVLVTSGYTECSRCNAEGYPQLIVNPDVEIYDPKRDAFSVVGQFNFTFLYPFMHLLSNGSVLHIGEFPTSWSFNPQSSSWQPFADSDFGYRYYATSVLLPGYTDKVMIIGGEPHADVPLTNITEPPTNTTEVIDCAAPSPQWQLAAPMSLGRCHPNAVILPDATVLVVGGRVDSCFGLNPFTAAYLAEQYDPHAPSPVWEPRASMDRPRMYHAIAMLLPDGRVLTAGGTAVVGMPNDEQDATIYYPSYLFRGPRPQITASPHSAAYNSTFTINTPQAQSIAAVVLIRFSSVTHSVNTDQRYVGLSFKARGADTLTATAPANGNLAPPGDYMLFVVNKAKVPSVARIVRLEL